MMLKQQCKRIFAKKVNSLQLLFPNILYLQLEHEFGVLMSRPRTHHLESTLHRG